MERWDEKSFTRKQSSFVLKSDFLTNFVQSTYLKNVIGHNAYGQKSADKTVADKIPADKRITDKMPAD